MNKRINVLLPEATVALLDRVAVKGNRSQFISRAVTHFVETQGKQSLREHLAAGYKANAEDSLRMAAEWFPLEEEAWHKAELGSPATKKRKR
jgi:metal-responsive CopG/Arc/MetJ family transcriptional regulator